MGTARARNFGKATERAVMGALGGQRVSNHALGKRTHDGIAGGFSVEVKARGDLPQWLLDAVAQNTRNCPDGMTPVTVLHQKGRRHAGDLVVMRLDVFKDWFGDLGLVDMTEDEEGPGE